MHQYRRSWALNFILALSTWCCFRKAVEASHMENETKTFRLRLNLAKQVKAGHCYIVKNFARVANFNQIAAPGKTAVYSHKEV